ncbi:MAG TPA: sulfatase-like hydrolase/transferase [Rhodanobacteraceae bacterium]|nr:sulfatase-like hydrolase/transferase [Rhodanobacteraceae bacterium]
MSKFVTTARNPVLLRILPAILLAVLFMLATGLLDGNPGVAPVRLLLAPWPLFANALPGLLLALVLLALTRRWVLSLLLAFGAEALLYWVNAQKVANLASPLVPADFHMLGQLQHGGAHLLSGYAHLGGWLILVVIGGVIALIGLWIYEPPLIPRRALPRGGIAACAAAALLSLCAGVPGWRAIYDRGALQFQPWSAQATAKRSGVIAMLALYRLDYAGQHSKIDKQAARTLLDRTEPAVRAAMAAGNDGMRPDIVIVQSESFFNPGRMVGYAPYQFIPNFERLAAEGESGPLHVPTFGGGTIRTEFEVLTGLPLRYFPQVQFPYLQMDAKVIPGLARTLRSNGYTTLAIHDNDPSFWNRASALQRLGFDRFIAINDFPKDVPHDGRYVADSALTDEILKQLRDTGPPQLVFAISMEAHGPYDGNPGPINLAERNAIPVPAGVTGVAKTMLQTYLYHLRHADAQLGRLAEVLSHRARPTLLLFYGDHLPALGQAFEINGFKDGGDQLEQTGSWLMVDPAHPHQSPPEALASWALPGQLLERAGIRDDPWFALTDVLAPQLSALTRAPDAPPAPENAKQRTLDHGMTNVAQLRLKGKLDKLLPETESAAAMAARAPHPSVAARPDGILQ